MVISNSIPYPSFTSPVEAKKASLATIGRCRVSLENESILAKCRAAQAASTDKAEQKKCIKEAVALAKEYFQEEFGLDVSIVNVEVLILDLADVMSTDGILASCLLDAGCATVVLNTSTTDQQEQLREAIHVARIPRERLMVHCHAGMEDGEVVVSSAERIIQAVAEDAYAVSFAVSDPVALDDAIIQAAAEGKVDLIMELYCSLTTHGLTSDEIAPLCRHTEKEGPNIAVCLVDPPAELLGLSYAACLKTDREDGLYTTVVCSRTGEALGLVYSSKESIVAALESGRGVYFSRSRNELWRKGDTSGHYQTLHRLDTDCDGDALRFTVTQASPGDEETAAFCHLKTRTCWGEPHGLRHLEQVLKERKQSAPTGSYTKRLFDDPILLRDKLVEEAQELAEAETPQHVAEELADVLYFAMVRAAAAGVSIDAAVAELDRRHRKVTRRPGDSKSFRIEAGQKILDKKK